MKCYTSASTEKSCWVPPGNVLSELFFGAKCSDLVEGGVLLNIFIPSLDLLGIIHDGWFQNRTIVEKPIFKF